MNGTKVQEGFFKRNGKKIVITVIAIVSAVVMMVGSIILYVKPWNLYEEEVFTDEQIMTNCCKTVYVQVRAGLINSEDTENNGDLCIWAAPKGADEEIRYRTASKVTVWDAMEYNGVNIDVSKMYYYTEATDEHKKGYIESYREDKQTKYDTIRKLEYDTTLGELYDGKK